MSQAQQFQDQNNKLHSTKGDQQGNSTILRFFDLYFGQEEKPCQSHNSKVKKCQIGAERKMEQQYRREDQGCRCHRQSGVDLGTCFVPVLVFLCLLYTSPSPRD